MIQIELLAGYGILAGFNLAIFLAICLSHKKTSLKRIDELKEDWFFYLPIQFTILADDIVDGEINKKQAPDELKKIISKYDKLQELEDAYIGKGVKNIINLLLYISFNSFHSFNV